MKKVLYSIFILLLSVVFTKSVEASSFNMTLDGDSSFESEITLSLKVGELTEFESGLYGLTGYLEYDDSKIELTSIDSAGEFDLTYGSKSKKVVLYSTSGAGTGSTILTIKFKNISLAKDETTTIELNTLVASDGNKDIEGNSTSKEVKFIIKEEEKIPENNNNDDNTEDTTQDNGNNSNSNNNSSSSSNNSNNTSGSTTETKKEETKSDNNYLSSITLSSGNIKFSKDVLTYDVIVDNDTTSIEIKAKTEDEKSTIDGTGKYDLKVGSNKIKLVVKAEDDSERTYTINVNREEKDIVVNNDIEVNEKNDNENTSGNNYIFYGIISLLVVVIIVLLIVIFKKKNNKVAN